VRVCRDCIYFKKNCYEDIPRAQHKIHPHALMCEDGMTQSEEEDFARWWGP
jgi:hypothetical protein